MEDITTRAIIIGVSVLIAVATISAVMTYYSTAQEMVRKIGSGTDIAGLYDKGIEDTLLKTNVRGVDVKNLINYFAAKGGAKIRFGDISNSKFANIYNNEDGTVNYEFYKDYTDPVNLKDIRDQIIPSAQYTIGHSLNGGILEITVTGGN